MRDNLERLLLAMGDEKILTSEVISKALIEYNKMLIGEILIEVEKVKDRTWQINYHGGYEKAIEEFIKVVK